MLLWAGGGCTPAAVAVAGRAPNTYLYGTEPPLMELEAGSPPFVVPCLCRDCGVDRLEMHHPGCVVAWCRDCDDQAFGCDHCGEDAR
jgi:hypothetical protein